ncbi:MAG: hypothetical protein ACI9WU_003468 [Myxococcota bacterium]|jgi:hypothetical protein
MTAQQTIFKAPQTTVRRLAGPMIPADVMERSRKRLALISLVFAVLFGIGTVAALAGVLAAKSGLPTPVSEGFLQIRVAVRGLALAIALAMMWTARRSKLSDETVLKLGMLFMVFNCYQTALTHNWYVLTTFGHPSFITWTTPIIIIFASLVPATPSVTLVAGLFASLTEPASIVVLTMMGIAPFEPSHILIVWGSPIAAAFVGRGIAVVLYRLSADIAAAQRAGSYQLEELLGKGGMGEVWRASHQMLARPAAVKLIRTDTDSPELARVARKRFEREAQATAALNSPHTVALYDFGTTHDGAFYYVMELLHGLDLRSLVERFGPMPPERVVHVLLQACDSLADAHFTGMVHRDVKPANIFVCKKGLRFDYIKVLDFGLVGLHQPDAGSDAQLTNDGIVGGTPAFMAPEQAIGQGVDERADIYALGCVAYWMLTGRLVFEGETAMSVIVSHARDTPAPIASVSELAVPEALEAVIMECLAKAPADRPQTAESLAERLRALDVGTWGPERARAWWERHRI